MTIPYLLFLSSAIATNVAAQILSCGDLPACPLQGSLAQCDLEGFVTNTLGVSEVNTTLTTEPLTWTVTVGKDHYENATTMLYRKDFYLGQPPSAQLQASTSVAGCALFFEGASTSLQIPGNSAGNYLEPDARCTDVLSSQCISDWVDQVRNEVNKTTASGAQMVCSDLAAALQDNRPSQCNSTTGSWGAVYAKGESARRNHVIGNKADPKQRLLVLRALLLLV